MPCVRVLTYEGGFCVGTYVCDCVSVLFVSVECVSVDGVVSAGFILSKGATVCHCYCRMFWCAGCECHSISVCCLCQCTVVCNVLVGVSEMVCVHVIVFV